MADRKNGESYSFKSLEDMERAIKRAVGSLENEAIEFGQHKDLTFYPTGSKLFDENVRRAFLAFGKKNSVQMNAQ